MSFWFLLCKCSQNTLIQAVSQLSRVQSFPTKEFRVISVWGLISLWSRELLIIDRHSSGKFDCIIMLLYVGSTIYIKNVEKLFSPDYMMFSKKNAGLILVDFVIFLLLHANPPACLKIVVRLASLQVQINTVNTHK